jgi:hypothetical protein
MIERGAAPDAFLDVLSEGGSGYYFFGREKAGLDTEVDGFR